ncbi:MAG: anti-sigma factor [Planctomycetes bacterium]|nr:anti-sigma factor [Planctomycetota bacterium]
MSSRLERWSEADFDAAYAEATEGLGRSERARMLERVGSEEFEELELLLAQVHVAGLGRLETPPAGLLQKLREQAPAAAPHRAPRRISAAGWSAALGWSIAAALVLWIALRAPTAPREDPGELRERLMASAADLVRADWSATADPLAGGVNGDVVWSSSRQQGYMRLSRLPGNDARQRQYQLWIFDKSRAEWEARPVDGGVFDVPAGGDVVVPISAKLEVREPALFAITLETPGGVVVSKREHLLATAAP